MPVYQYSPATYITCLTLHVTLPFTAVSANGPCKPINYCAKSVCKNGATCSSSPSGFSCKCVAGYTGTMCQHNKDECASSPCVHGDCTDGVNGYSCKCFDSYAGKYPTPVIQVEARSYIAQYPVLRTVQSALQFTAQTNLFTQTPLRPLWEASSHMLQLMGEGCSYTYPPLSVARYPFIHLSELEQCRVKKRAQGFNTAAQDSNPGSGSRESKALSLSNCAHNTNR